MGRSGSTDEAYWKDYDGLQAVKHRILAKYLSGWFPILSTFKGQLLYLDCHAGRGRHVTGDPGSPILVLEQLRDHRLLPQILDRVAIACHFFELDQSNADRLREEIAEVGVLHPRIGVHVHSTDYEAALSQALDELDEVGKELPPSFAFIDPYGFKLSMNFMNRLLSAGRTEILINVMYRYVDMAVPRAPMATILDKLFGTPDWRRLRQIDDKQARFTAFVRLFSAQLAATHVSWIVMRGDSGEVKYVLFHGTNSLAGRRVMKQAIWAALPDGSATAYERDRPEQGVLISATQNHDREIATLLEKRLGGKTVRLFEDVYPVVDASLYRRVHVHPVLRLAVKQGSVRNVDHPGKFVISTNPRLQIPVAFSLAKEPKQSDLFGES